jgi:hypothetical protein
LMNLIPKAKYAFPSAAIERRLFEAIQREAVVFDPSVVMVSEVEGALILICFLGKGFTFRFQLGAAFAPRSRCSRRDGCIRRLLMILLSLTLPGRLPGT